MLRKPRIAYFCLEFGIRPELKTYAGGLGILAGDTLKSAADMGMDMLGVSLLYKQGYFKQIIDQNGKQQAQPDTWNFADLLKLVLPPTTITLGSRQAKVQVWEHTIVSQSRVPVYFLDFDLESNPLEIREISKTLYPSEDILKIRQEIALGIGGVEVLSLLPGSAVDVYHLNESHAGFGILPLLQKMEAGEVRKRVCFTTHTPVPAGHQKFDMNLVEPELGYLAKYIPEDLVTDGILEMTELCLRYSEFANGVSQKHKYVSQNMFPEFPIEYVTNGIHHLTWLSDHLAEIFDAKLPGWRQNPEHLRMARNLPSEEILQAHAKAKKDMTNFLNQRYHVELSDKVFTIGFARRAAYYKRANLIFQDKKRLEDIAGKFGGIQLIFSGKAHPADTLGQEFIREISELAKTTAESLKVVYIPDYGMELSKHLVGGVDVWLNNPIVPMEASGTSGMKASLNGIPNISTLDGWWLEGWVENVTGWAIGAGCEGEICEPKEVEDLYGILENTVLPTYHGDSQAWANIQKHCIAENGSFFTTHRMLQEYLVKGYLGGW